MNQKRSKNYIDDEFNIRTYRRNKRIPLSLKSHLEDWIRIQGVFNTLEWRLIQREAETRYKLTRDAKYRLLKNRG